MTFIRGLRGLRGLSQSVTSGAGREAAGPRERRAARTRATRIMGSRSRRPPFTRARLRRAAGVRLQWRHDREVEVLSRQTLSGLYPTITASLRSGVGSNRRRMVGPQEDERDSAGCLDEPAQRWRSLKHTAYATVAAKAMRGGHHVIGGGTRGRSDAGRGETWEMR